MPSDRASAPRKRTTGGLTSKCRNGTKHCGCNAAAADYNGAREAFPAALFSNTLGFNQQGFWELGAEERPAILVAPEVKF